MSTDLAIKTRSPISHYTLILLFILFPCFLIFVLKGLYILITIGFILTLVSELYVRRGAIWRIPASGPVYFFLTVPIISVLWSQYPDETIFHGITTFSLIFLFYLTAHANKQTDFNTIRILSLLIPYVILLSAILIFIRFGSFRPSSEKMYNVVGSYSNISSAASVLCVPFLLAFRLNDARKLKYLFALAAAFLVVLMSLSRGAFGAFFISIIVAFMFMPGHAETRVLRVLKWIIIISIVTSLAILALGYDQVIGILWKRIVSSELLSPHLYGRATAEQSDFWRLTMYIAGIKAIQQNPIWGIGYSSLRQFMENYYGTGLVSHNIIITYWGEIGIIGLCALIWLVVRLRKIQFAFVNDRRMLEKDRILMAAAISSTWTAFFYSLVRPFESTYMLFVAIGVVYALHQKRKSVRYSTRNEDWLTPALATP